MGRTRRSAAGGRAPASLQSVAARSWAARDHSIIVSARCSSAGAIGSPMAVATFRLITNSNLVACSMGRSAGGRALEDLVSIARGITARGEAVDAVGEQGSRGDESSGLGGDREAPLGGARNDPQHGIRNETTEHKDPLDFLRLERCEYLIDLGQPDDGSFHRLDLESRRGSLDLLALSARYRVVGVEQHEQSGEAGHQLLKHLQSLGEELAPELRETGQVAARAS